MRKWRLYLGELASRPSETASGTKEMDCFFPNVQTVALGVLRFAGADLCTWGVGLFGQLQKRTILLYLESFKKVLGVSSCQVASCDCLTSNSTCREWLNPHPTMDRMTNQYILAILRGCENISYLQTLEILKQYAWMCSTVDGMSGHVKATSFYSVQ